MWSHISSTDEVDLLFRQPNCIFCKTEMLVEHIENRWPLDNSLLRREHEMAMDAGAKYEDEIYSLHRPIVSEFTVEGVSFNCCPACGWWCIFQEILYETPSMPYLAFQWAAGALISQEFPCINAPMSEIRNYLCAHYDQRFMINPYLLEDVVASIFRSFKCNVYISNRSHDGGLDVFGFDQKDRPFGIQVKRHRRKIDVEQLRSFVGALTLHNHLRGIFVTTSSFTRGATSLRHQAKIAGIQLRCVDADKLFEMLKAAQILEFDQQNIRELALTYGRNISCLNYGGAFHLATL